MDRAQLDRKIVDGAVVEQATGPLAVATARCRSWGWPISHTGSRILLSTGAQVSAVELAEELAAEVQRFLTIRMLSGPAVALPGAPRRWLLLAASADEAPQAMIDRLHRRGGVTHRGGALVPLPPSRLACGQVTWQVPPALVDPWLPPLTAITVAVRSLTDPPGTP
ncbi:MAG TPA: hypothetical protein VE709_05800 [Pseudonocardiaceae bacterium]|nr:hypothetical protein [Pseudonocardiaceae bacterium]